MDTFSILMPLKDRVSYTRRIMNKWNSEGFPYEIIIADGGQDLYIQEELSDKSNFENLNYTYIKYPFDMDLNNFYAKMADAVMKIKTFIGWDIGGSNTKISIIKSNKAKPIR